MTPIHRLHGDEFMDVKWMTMGAAAALLCHSDINAQVSTHEQPTYVDQVPFDLKEKFGTTGDWKAVVTAVATSDYLIPDYQAPSQSRICFVQTSSNVSECSYFRDMFHSDLTLQVLSGLSVVLLKEGSPSVKGLVMKASGLYATGQTHETAIWIYDAQLDDFHLASSQVNIEDSVGRP
jgi:hypothetical protein